MTIDLALCSRCSKRVLLMSAGGARPIGLVAQAFGGEHHWSRYPTAPELRAMTYLGVVHGASAGVTYWLR